MKNFKENALVQEMSVEEMMNVNGGDGEWHIGEALLAFALFGIVGVGAYTLGTMQD